MSASGEARWDYGGNCCGQQSGSSASGEIQLLRNPAFALLGFCPRETKTCVRWNLARERPYRQDPYSRRAGVARTPTAEARTDATQWNSILPQKGAQPSHHHEDTTERGTRSQRTRMAWHDSSHVKLQSRKTHGDRGGPGAVRARRRAGRNRGALQAPDDALLRSSRVTLMGPAGR